MRNLLFATLPLMTVLCTGCASLRGLLPAGGTPADRLADVSIVRDEWGVPHILAATDEGVMFGLGYAQAEDDFRQIEEDYLHALGRASHWYGERSLPWDLVMKAFEVERLAREEYAREPADRRVLWDAFAAGVNHYVRSSGVRPRLITSFEPWMPFALMRSLVLRGTFDGVRLGVIDVSAASAGQHVQPVGVPDSLAVFVRDRSHAFAVAPSRTEGGHAVLIESLYSDFSGPGRPYEFMILSDAGWHVSGVAVLGTPMPRSGHNEHMAWAQSATGHDIADVYEITFDNPDDGTMYRYDGAWQAALDRQDTLLVNSPAGVVQRVFRFRRTLHGPIVAVSGERSLALRVARMEDGGALQQSYALSRARGLAEFRAALESGGYPAAVTYADTAGNVMHVPATSLPVRDTTFDWTRPLNGTTPATVWRGFHTMGDLPQVLNPDAGRVSTEAIEALRADTARSVAALAAVPFDTRVWGAEAHIAELAAEWERLGGSDAARARRLDAAIDVLRSWDHMAAAESEAATLYLLWQEQLRALQYLGEFTNFRAMENVLAGLERHHGSSTVPWGEVNRIQRVNAADETFSADRPSLGVGGAPAWAGSAWTIDAAAAQAGERRYAIRGHSWIRAVELGPQIRSRSVIPFGQSADPASRHYFDQAALYVRGGMKPARFSREEVLSSGGRRYSPGDAVRELP